MRVVALGRGRGFRRLCRTLIAGAVLLVGAVAQAGAQGAQPAGGSAGGGEPPVAVRGEVTMRPELDVVSGVQGWRVNGEEIGVGEVRDRAVLFHGRYILQDLVSAALLGQEAARRGVTVTEAEVETQIKALREELGLRSDQALEFHLRQRRLTREGFRQQAREYLLLAKTLADRVYVADWEVEFFYNKYRDSLYTRRESVEFRIMTFQTEAAAMATKRELAQGRNFEEVAKRVAREHGAEEAEVAVAGTPNLYQRGQQGLPLDLGAALFGAPLNQVVGPVEWTVGPVSQAKAYSLVKVEKKTDPHVVPLNDAREDIRLMLRRQKLEQVVWPQWIGEQLENANIEVIRAEGASSAGQGSGSAGAVTAPDEPSQPGQEGQPQPADEEEGASDAYD
jgi:foldase protein PrsA